MSRRQAHRERARKQHAATHATSDSRRKIKEVVVRPYRAILLHVPQAKGAVCRCGGELVLGDEFHIRNCFAVSIEHVQRLRNVTQVIIMNAVVCRSHLPSHVIIITKSEHDTHLRENHWKQDINVLSTLQRIPILTFP